MTNNFHITDNISVGGGHPPILIAGPCVIENEDMILRHAERLAEMTTRIKFPMIFKASYDKANRTSIDSFRGPGIEDGLSILVKVKQKFGLPILTDFHSVKEIEIGGGVVDVIQIPAFLCRQTDLLVTAAKSDKPVNVKKGQFLSPADMEHVVRKLTEAGCQRILLTERGATFGYNRLVVDFTGIVEMRKFGYPIVFDATHSVQAPGGLAGKSGGDGSKAPYLAYAAAAVGVDALFVETHEDPAQALSDGPNMIPLDILEDVLKRFLDIHHHGARDI
ncbi:3-deoxy-8-phosphooctulonate synthase [Calditrichota bacterium]